MNKNMYDSNNNSNNNSSIDFVEETAAEYTSRKFAEKKQGEYTVEDYYNFPEDRRVELIDGVIYDMSSPSTEHQLVAPYIYSKLLNYVLENKGKCVPMCSPADVQLDKDDKTMVQPDVFVVCDKSKILNRCTYGAPDMIIEVLSPSTRNKDMGIKNIKYEKAGVREYWMVDFQKEKVIVYLFGEEKDINIYPLDANVPVAIWDGKFSIDFKEVIDYVHSVLEES